MKLHALFIKFAVFFIDTIVSEEHSVLHLKVIFELVEYSEDVT
jgi:hypothetical protein